MTCSRIAIFPPSLFFSSPFCRLQSDFLPLIDNLCHFRYQYKCIYRTPVFPPQVFHVPVEERRFGGDGGSFGSESRQAEIIREVMERTSCTIEISQPKDHSLTIMVSGKPSSVLVARKEVLSKLQTQVSKKYMIVSLLEIDFYDTFSSQKLPNFGQFLHHNIITSGSEYNYRPRLCRIKDLDNPGSDNCGSRFEDLLVLELDQPAAQDFLPFTTIKTN